MTYIDFLGERLVKDIVYSEYIGINDDDLIKMAEKKVIATNRERKIDSILFNKKFEPLKIEDTEEYKEARNVIPYSEYLAENLDKQIKYSEYLANNDNIKYSEYIKKYE